MVFDLGKLGQGRDDKQEIEDGEERGNEYVPQQILALECALRLMPTPMGELVFVTLLCQDTGGEKMLWFPPPMAKEVGGELVRLANVAATELPAMPQKNLQIAQINPDDVLRRLRGG